MTRPRTQSARPGRRAHFTCAHRGGHVIAAGSLFSWPGLPITVDELEAMRGHSAGIERAHHPPPQRPLCMVIVVCHHPTWR